MNLDRLLTKKPEVREFLHQEFNKWLELATFRSEKKLTDVSILSKLSKVF